MIEVTKSDRIDSVVTGMLAFGVIGTLAGGMLLTQLYAEMWLRPDVIPTVYWVTDACYNDPDMACGQPAMAPLLIGLVYSVGVIGVGTLAYKGCQKIGDTND